ncbi:N-acetylmuramoyl-L-alanine amidase family protein [Clostridium butyricum]|uniref:N-acetylmuramoyl-L-alanine amidase family protein n=1 Tax=Clostridium butyricum TaxID=1492 RepID=UPI00374F0ED7
MIKRMNKLTALMVAATAVASIVPAVSASAATKLEVKEGNIESAIAYGDGKYVYEGYMTEDDESGMYFNNGTKDAYLENDEDYDFGAKYGTKYLTVNDGEDYLLDLSTGKILDDESVEDLRHNVELKLKTTLKKADRYATSDTNKIEFVDSEGKDSITQILDGQFGDVWYSYSVANDDSSDESTVGAMTYGFVNESGKYIDASILANMTVATTDSAVTVRVTEFGKEKNNVKVQLASAPEVIAQDSNYLYAITTVNVKIGENSDGTRTYIQKISKAQGDTKDGAYMPKSVDSYEINADFKIDNDSDDTKKASDLLLGEVKEGNKHISTQVIKDTIYVTTLEADKVVVNTIKLKKEKVTTTNNAEKKLDVYVAVKDQDDDQKLDSKNEKSISIDANGNTWAVNKGTIYKFNGTEFVEVYTCDRTIDTLDVYDENNLIAWNEENEIFATVQNKDEEGTDEGDKEETKAGWVTNADGTWSYNKADGTKTTGWLLDGSTWYYFNANGAMQTGWVNVNGTWYYLNPVSNGYKGAMQTGWLNDNGTWYYLQSNGAMKTGWLNDNGTWYYLQSNGAMKTGWLNDNGTWYYLNSNGSMKTGWLNDNGTWYFLQSNGAMAKNTTVDGYKLGSNGAWIR